MWVYKGRNYFLSAKIFKLSDFIRIQEKDEKIQSVEESLQSAMEKESERKKAMEVSV